MSEDPTAGAEEADCTCPKCVDGGGTVERTDGETADTETHTCEFVNEGVEIEVPEDEYVLEAALDADVELPFSCLQGVCATCSANVEGDIDQSEGHALTDWERGQGYALLCVTYPRSDLTIHSNEEP